MLVTRWLIESSDRVGMIHDIVREFSCQKINIGLMDVYPGQVFVKFQTNGLDGSKDRLFKRLSSLKDVNDIKTIDLLPYEKKEKELQAIMESVTDGIISLTQDGYITYFNSDIPEFFGIPHDQMVGLHINVLTENKAEKQIANLLAGKSFDNYQIITDSLHYISSGRAILGGKSKVIGAVLTLKSMKATQQLINSITQSQPFAFDNIIRASDVIENVIKLATKVANSKYTILIRGETGTGKELFARAIHNASDRRNYPFSPVNCAALPEMLLESELFGYESGAFSGAARSGKVGLFESTNNGTIFLDEFGELSLILQSKLLRVLQDGMIRRVGGTKYIPVDVRIIVATNRNLEDMVEKQQFRQDLYYRINIIPINIPPLRQRPKDIPLLLDYFMEKYCLELDKNLVLSPPAYDYLVNYSWPGNVRELQNVILRAIHLVSSHTIEVSDLLITNERPLHLNTNDNEDFPNLKKTIKETEKDILVKMLKKHGSARAVARAIGLSHTAVSKKLKLYQLEHLLPSRVVKK